MKPGLFQKIMILVIVFRCLQTAAQPAAKIYGIVHDQNHAPLSWVTISLLHARDSSLARIELTDEKGRFEMPSVHAGPFLLRYAAIGFETVYSTVIELSPGQSFQATAVSLKIVMAALQEVRITAKKPLVEVKPGKTIFNVQNSITSAGSHALELLQKLPGIRVDNNDNISMTGKTGVTIYVDGKMIQLSAEDRAAYLRTVSSHDIESIEIITNPGARFDASGSAGIINIRLKKNSSLGTNGNVSAGMVQGITPKGNGAASINFRNNKLNIFSNASAGIGRYEADIIAPRTQKDTIYDQQLLQFSNRKTYAVKSGVDVFINSRQTIGIMNSSSYNSDDWISYGNTGIFYQPTKNYIKRLEALNKIPRQRTHVNTNLNYRYADTMGLELNVDADYGFYRGRAKSYQPNYYLDKDGNLLSSVITHNNTPTDIDIYTAKLDMTLPAWKGQLSFGAKHSYVKTGNTLDFFMQVDDDKLLVPERSYHFVYKERVNGAYISFRRQFDPMWTFQAGLRTEQTSSEGLLLRADGMIQADNNVKRSYWDFFPNLQLTLSPNKNHSLNLSYSRRIDRPNYQVLNPFELKLDELSYVKGNSFLRPQYTGHIEFSHEWKNKFTATASYSRVKDLATQTVDSVHNATYAMARNLATQQIGTISISAPLAISSWWSGFMNAWFNYQVFNGKVNEHSVRMEMPGFGAFVQQSLQLGKEYTAELSGWLNGPSALGPTLKAKSMGALDIGIQKLLFNKRATLKISATDIFRSSIPLRAKTDFGGVLLDFRVSNESRTLRVNFSYRFGNNKVKAARQRQSGLDNEAKRIRES